MSTQASMDPGANTMDRGIAVIGIAGRFPQADDVDAFWKNLEQGRESVRRIDPEVVAASGFDPALTRKPNYVNVAGRLDAIDMFDPAFFSMSQREAELREPQHRLLLETCYQALQNAGYVPGRYAGAISLYATIGKSSYLYKNLLSRQELVDTLGVHALFLSNDKDFASTFVSYKLHLTGASMTVSSGCSSSLVAVHLAIQNLLNHESDIALAGGASINWNQDFGYHYEEGGIHPADGRVRPFDARAQGTVGGSGAGIVALKRLADAIESGDHIHGVIRGCAVNNDGKDKIGYAAPSVSGQASVIREALRRAQVDSRSISYVETHGTGTILGDPIEMQALSEAYGPGAGPESCAVGSVKSNIGHLDAAAGVAGLIKVLLSMQHRKRPPSLNFERLNPEIDLAGGPFYVNDRLTSWDGPEPLRAGLSSLGIGGTNVHMIVEAAPARAALDERGGDEAQLLVLSAKSRYSIEAAQRQLIAFLKAHPDVNLADCAFTLQEGREHFPWRAAVTARNVAEAIDRLSVASARETTEIGGSERVPTVRPQQSLCEVLGELWMRGCAVDFRGLHTGRRPHRIPLPGYQFERKRCWVDPPATPGSEVRQAAPAIQVQRVADAPSDTRPVLPKIDNEATMRDIWRTCFNLDEIDANADFFELGGDSLLATKLVARIKERFDCSLSIRQFMDEPTFSGVLRAVAAPTRADEVQARVAERL